MCDDDDDGNDMAPATLRWLSVCVSTAVCADFRFLVDVFLLFIYCLLLPRCCGCYYWLLLLVIFLVILVFVMPMAYCAFRYAKDSFDMCEMRWLN